MTHPKLGLYTHSKTKKLYKLVCIAKHTETLEEFAVYEAQYDNPRSKFWIRPLTMFTEMVNINGDTVPRFVLADQ